MLKSISLRLCTLIVLLFAGIYSFAQQVQVKGTVVEKSSGESIIGASVMEVGSNSNGTITDIDGNFTLSVTSGATLSVSYIGYKTVTVKAQPTLRIELTEDSQLIDEVVVTGYMSEKKASLTGSVAVVKMKDVADIPTGNVLSSLQGRVAGMNITTDGTPGGGNTSTLVRGKSSFRNDANSPLYVIDGVMTRENISSILSSNDVESIQVLKDAASASIYGAQAANGVIIITTKRAKKGETRVDFDMSLTLQTYQCGFDMLNADEWGQVYWSAYKYANNGATPSNEIYGNGATPQLQDYIGLNGAKVHAVDTDWRDVVYRTALMQNYSATLSKGSDNGAFSLALNYLDHDGLVENTNFQRINTRISSNYHYLDNRLRIGENVAINRWTQTLSPAGVDENAIKQHPAKTVYDENGNYNDAINDVLGDAPNMARLLENEKQNKHDYWRVFGNAFLEIEPIKNLVLKTNFGMNYYDETNKTFEPAWARDEVNKLTQSSNKRLDWVWTNTVTYSKAFGKNNLTALLGTEAKKNHSESMFGYGTGLAVEDEDYIYLDGVTAGKNVGAGASNYGMVSYFGKVNYDYEGRYLASVTVRRDASSRLAKGNNVDYFPSVSAGWRISSEKFMEATKNWLADLKLRASWGVNGNDIIDNEAPYTKYLISLKDASYNMNGDGTTLAPGGYKVRSTNPDLKWESTRQLNIGVDAAFLNGRLSASLDYFDKKTSDMLVEKPYIAVIGEGGYCWYNGGTMNNKGFEMALTWNDKVKDFLTEYNNIINEMTKLYNADSAGSYEPLTDDEKDQMSDKEIEKWETKIKDSLLRRDSTLGSVMTAMQTAMMSSVEIGGKKYSLSSFGISTLGFLNAAENEQNAYHIDGDEDDANTSGKTDKLMAAINDDPDTVMQFMQQLSTNLYSAIGDKMKSTDLSSAFTIYNDKQMKTEYTNYTKTIKEWEKKISDREDYYYNKFTQMESAMTKLNSTQSSISSYFS